MGLPQINRPDCNAHVKDNEIVLDFSGMPLGKLVCIRRLGVGMSAESCDSWLDAAVTAADALGRYLDAKLNPVVTLGPGSFSITVTGDNTETLFTQIVSFFRTQYVTVESYAGIRARSLV